MSLDLRRAVLGAVAGLCLTVAGCATLQDASLGDILGTGAAPLDEPTVAAGLREALRIGTERTVGATSSVDGFLANELIRIAMPRQLESVAGTLRDVGLGRHVIELEIGMNRAAERAAGEAKDVFWSAITRMTIADAFAILNGDDTAATDYFRDRTSDELRARFGPIVSQKMQQVGLSRLYGDFVDLYNSVPLIDKPQAVDLDEYVTDEALSGLFTVLGQQERKIRNDPLARTTELLQRVFGR